MSKCCATPLRELFSVAQNYPRPSAKRPFMRLGATKRKARTGLSPCPHPCAMPVAGLALTALQAMLHQITANRATAERIGAADITAVAARTALQNTLARCGIRVAGAQSASEKRKKASFLIMMPSPDFYAGIKGTARWRQAILPAAPYYSATPLHAIPCFAEINTKEHRKQDQLNLLIYQIVNLFCA